MLITVIFLSIKPTIWLLGCMIHLAIFAYYGAPPPDFFAGATMQVAEPPLWIFGMLLFPLVFDKVVKCIPGFTRENHFYFAYLLLSLYMSPRLMEALLSAQIPPLNPLSVRGHPIGFLAAFLAACSILVTRKTGLRVRIAFIMIITVVLLGVSVVIHTSKRIQYVVVRHKDDAYVQIDLAISGYHLIRCEISPEEANSIIIYKGEYSFWPARAPEILEARIYLKDVDNVKLVSHR